MAGHHRIAVARPAAIGQQSSTEQARRTSRPSFAASEDGVSRRKGSAPASAYLSLHRRWPNERSMKGLTSVYIVAGDRTSLAGALPRASMGRGLGVVTTRNPTSARAGGRIGTSRTAQEREEPRRKDFPRAISALAVQRPMWVRSAEPDAQPSAGSRLELCCLLESPLAASSLGFRDRKGRTLDGVLK